MDVDCGVMLFQVSAVDRAKRSSRKAWTELTNLGTALHDTVRAFRHTCARHRVFGPTQSPGSTFVRLKYVPPEDDTANGRANRTEWRPLLLTLAILLLIVVIAVVL